MKRRDMLMSLLGLTGGTALAQGLPRVTLNEPSKTLKGAPPDPYTRWGVDPAVPGADRLVAELVKGDPYKLGFEIVNKKDSEEQIAEMIDRSVLGRPAGWQPWPDPQDLGTQMEMHKSAHQITLKLTPVSRDPETAGHQFEQLLRVIGRVCDRQDSPWEFFSLEFGGRLVSCVPLFQEIVTQGEPGFSCDRGDSPDEIRVLILHEDAHPQEKERSTFIMTPVMSDHGGLSRDLFRELVWKALDSARETCITPSAKVDEAGLSIYMSRARSKCFLRWSRHEIGGDVYGDFFTLPATTMFTAFGIPIITALGVHIDTFEIRVPIVYAPVDPVVNKL